MTVFVPSCHLPSDPLVQGRRRKLRPLPNPKLRPAPSPLSAGGTSGALLPSASSQRLPPKMSSGCSRIPRTLKTLVSPGLLDAWGRSWLCRCGCQKSCHMHVSSGLLSWYQDTRKQTAVHCQRASVLGIPRAGPCSGPQWIRKLDTVGCQVLVSVSAEESGRVPGLSTLGLAWVHSFMQSYPFSMHFSILTPDGFETTKPHLLENVNKTNLCGTDVFGNTVYQILSHNSYFATRTQLFRVSENSPCTNLSIRHLKIYLI